MVLDPSRIQGFGSDGVKKKIWHCPAGHHLQPKKAIVGKCDGCKCFIASGEPVMDCRQCNYYLCKECHPQEKDEAQDWFWGSVNYLIETAQQEMTEISEEFKDMAGEVEAFMADMSFASTCGVVAGQHCKDEISLDANGNPTRPRAASRGASKKKVPSSGTSSKAANPRPAQKPQRPQRATSNSAADRGSSPRRKVEEPRAKEKEEEAEPAAPKTPLAAAFEAKEAAAPVRPPAPTEDLMDIGQNDLLDLDAEPIISSPPSKVAPLSAARGQPLQSLFFDAHAAGAPGTCAAAMTADSAPQTPQWADFGAFVSA